MSAGRFVVGRVLLVVAGFAAVQGLADEPSPDVPAALPYAIVDTGQIRCYDNRTEIVYPAAGEAFFGQDAHYEGLQPSYQDNGDGTVTDLNTRLMWIQDPGAKKTFAQAVAGAARCTVGGYDDWRLPSIKELYSLILFSGEDPDPRSSQTSSLTPFIDSSVFTFTYGRASAGERTIDSQYASATEYVHTTMGGNATVFGVNFADGRIKGYPSGRGPRGEPKTYYVLYVRGSTDYGVNDFVDNGDGTVTDRATGLTWAQADSGRGMNWQQALAYAEGLSLAGHDDWRLPNAKELQSIVDYTRSPDTTRSAAIDPVFEVTAITNEGGRPDYPCYWTGTSHIRPDSASAAVYVAFGRALGYMQRPRSSRKTLMDVHGAGAQRSDPKSGDAGEFPEGRGPQGDVIRITNFVRCVRGGVAESRASGPAVEMRANSRSPRGGNGGGHRPPPRH
ncbi:MAG: Lcl C-terminal domain-containing protein [Planctomycetota bacterium]|jgi:hypothetical protein